MAQQMISNRKMVCDIVNNPVVPGPEEPTFTVLARVDSIFPHAGWCYATCHQCSKKIDAVGGLFVCNICDAPCRYPIIRYRVHVCVGDYTGGTIFTIFNQVAENLLDSSANKFFRYLGFQRFPVPLIELVGRYFAFRIRMPDYSNEDNDFHNTRVVGLFEISPSPDLKSYGRVQEKVARSKRRSRRAAAHVFKNGNAPSNPVLSIESAESTTRVAPYAEVSTPEKRCSSRKRRG